MMNVFQKHSKYIDMYKSNILYWGLGIENELYLEFDKLHDFNRDQFLNNHNKERYSVDYYCNYKKDILTKAFMLVDYNKCLESLVLTKGFPLLMNSFSFTKTDSKNNSTTIYSKKNGKNPLFNGTVLSDLIFKNNDYLNRNYDNNFVYDGDTIEFITTNFFNTTVSKVIYELISIKNNYITNLRRVFKEHNIFNEYGNINFMKKNHPFAIYLTNINNIGMFNNGTLHFNITLPTFLDKNGNINNREKFTEDHKNYIRFIQFMEPLLIAVYGTPDPFSDENISYLDENNSNLEFKLLFSACSQRCAISRYIGIGTYDTNTMTKGKLVTCNTNDIVVSKETYGWYNRYYKSCAYNKLNEIGYDINFNKHLNHGVEIRFFDHIDSTEEIKMILTFFVYLGDYSVKSANIMNPIYNKIWNDIVVNTMKYGKKLTLNEEHIILYNNIFNYKFLKTNIKDLYYEIFDLLKERALFSKINGFSSLGLDNIYFDV